MKTPTVQNMLGKSGREVPNQFEIFTPEGKYFQSYSTVIAFIPASGGKIVLDRDKWNYSRTTSRYRSLFLRESTKETERKIQDGTYKLQDLNA